MDSDVTLLVGPEKVPLLAHRLILTAHSEVFRAMLNPEIKREGETGQIELPNCTENTAKRLLQYLYTNQDGDTEELSLEVLEQK